ncbi:MAG: hypothetical protein AABZ63_08430 [Actinomycetota bacterium]
MFIEVHLAAFRQFTVYQEASRLYPSELIRGTWFSIFHNRPGVRVERKQLCTSAEVARSLNRVKQIPGRSLVVLPAAAARIMAARSD